MAFANPVSDRRPAQKRRTAAPGQDLSDDAARICPRQDVCVGRTRKNVLHARLTDDATSRQHFPFAFRLAVTYAVDDVHLDVRFAISNTSRETLPASLGGHPAFN